MRICEIEGCNKKHRSRGLCSAHYVRWRKHGDPLGGGTSPGDPLNFYIEKVLPYNDDDCLIWPYSKSRGYGTLYYNGRHRYVHVIACKEIYGEPPTEKHEVAHSCGRGKQGCVNPNHLRWATPIENQRDRLKHGTHSRGEKMGASKLKEYQVLEIRNLYGKMKNIEIAEKYNISPSLVSNIAARRRWGWLE